LGGAGKEDKGNTSGKPFGQGGVEILEPEKENYRDFGETGKKRRQVGVKKKGIYRC